MNLLKLAVVLGTAVFCDAAASFGAVTYQQTGTTGLANNTALLPSILEDINLAAATTSPQQLTNITFGYAVLANTAAQTGAVFVDFYDTFTPTSTGSVVSNYIGGFGGTLNITANTTAAVAYRSAGFSGLAGLSTPVNFADNNFAVVLTFTNSDGTLYSTVLTPFTSTNTPTIGTSTAGVYRDTNSDGTFQATELNATGGNYYMSLTTVPLVPEPGTWAMIALGGIGGLAVWRKRTAAVA